LTLRTAANDAAATAVEAARVAKATDDALVVAIAELERLAALGEPISVFVSRSTQRVYIRQGRRPVFDVEIAIKNPDQPIGTHVFTAMSPSAKGDDVNWSLVTLPAEAPISKAQRRSGTAPVPSDAAVGKAVLDRLEMPQSVINRVGPSLRAGSSLIVSDLTLSFETGQGTDFIVQTRGEEKAIESVRRIVAERERGRRR
jgi:hypothetical protein